MPNMDELICWKKTQVTPTSGRLIRIWEPIFVLNFGNEPFLDKRREGVYNFWDISNSNSQTDEHKACYPVELVTKGINLASEENDILFDPFLGSGTSLIACEKTKRFCYGVEIYPKYMDIIIQRYVDFSGNTKIIRNGVEMDWPMTVNEEEK